MTPWNFKQNFNIVFLKNVFDVIVSKIMSILGGPWVMNGNDP